MAVQNEGAPSREKEGALCPEFTTKEVIANSVNVGETEAILLKTIEEAYLYIGEAKREIKELNRKNVELEKRLQKLEGK